MGFARLFFTAMMICCGCFVQNLAAQSVTSTVDKKAILIGEQIKYRLFFNFPDDDYRVEFNVPDTIAHFEIMNKNKFDSTHKKEFYIVQDILLTSWDSGKWIIPSLPLKLKKLSTGRVYDLKSDEFTIDVGYAPADGADTLRDVKPIRGVAFEDNTWMFIIAGVLVGFVLLYAMLRYFKKRPKKIPVKINKNAYEDAIAAINDLRKTRTDTQLSAKLFYTALGDIFRTYYQTKSLQNLETKTTAEVVNMLRSEDGNHSTANFVQEALGTGDAAKFAKYLPAVEENDKCCDFVASAIKTIEELRQKK